MADDRNKPKDKDRRDLGGGKNVGEEGKTPPTKPPPAKPSGTKEVKENLDVKESIKHEKS